MGTWGLIQLGFDIFIGLGVFIIAMRMSRQPKDDPRLSRGLQLLQAKIAVIEDLSDRTEVQVNQMSSLLEQKAREVQNKVQMADRQVQLIRSAMERSLEIAQIFQDKIPHQEIIERQNTLKYLKAARMAHQGTSVEEIAKVVDLPKGEIEFIAKVNRDQLMFSEDQLPAWARSGNTMMDFVEDENMPEGIGAGTGASAQAGSGEAPVARQVSASGQVQMNRSGPITSEEARRHAVEETLRLSQMANQQELLEGLQSTQRELNEMVKTDSSRRDYRDVFNVPKAPTESLSKLGEEFRKACADTTSTQRAAACGPLLDLSPDDLETLKRSFQAQQNVPATPGTPVVTAPLANAATVISAPTEGVSAASAPAESASAVALPRVSTPTPPAPVVSAAPRVINARSTQGEPIVVKKVEFPRLNSDEINR